MSAPPAFPVRKTLPHATPPWVKESAIFFITICCVRRNENQICHPMTAGMMLETIEFRHCRGDWFVHLFVLMPDHVHGLISFPRERDLRKVIANWKEISAKMTGIRWQRDFFDHRLRAEESYEEKARYIRMNPVRKGLVASPENWVHVWEPPR